MNQEEKNNENYYRYIHEHNIINFFMNCARELADYMIANQNNRENTFFCRTLLCLVNLGFLKANNLRSALINRKNLLNVNDFEAFTSCKKYEQLID